MFIPKSLERYFINRAEPPGFLCESDFNRDITPDLRDKLPEMGLDLGENNHVLMRFSFLRGNNKYTEMLPHGGMVADTNDKLYLLKTGRYCDVDVDRSTLNGYVKVGDFCKVKYRHGGNTYLFGTDLLYSIIGNNCCTIKAETYVSQYGGGPACPDAPEGVLGFKGDSFDLSLSLYISSYYNWNVLGSVTTGTLEVFYNAEPLVKYEAGDTFDFGGVDKKALMKSIRMFKYRYNYGGTKERYERPRGQCA